VRVTCCDDNDDTENDTGFKKFNFDSTISFYRVSAKSNSTIISFLPDEYEYILVLGTINNDVMLRLR
jgi:hypothetical protein